MLGLSPAQTVLFGGVAAVLALDTVASSATRWLGFPYKLAMLASLAIYATVGYFTGRADPTASPALAAAIVGVVESTAGWAISWAIGPGRPATMKHIRTQMLLAVLGGATIAAAVGWAGGWLARRA